MGDKLRSGNELQATNDDSAAGISRREFLESVMKRVLPSLALVGFGLNLAGCGGGGSDDCGGTCTTTCTGSCYKTCTNDCQGTCTGGCTGTCTAVCGGQCTGGCEGACTGCEGTCENTCQALVY